MIVIYLYVNIGVLNFFLPMSRSYTPFISFILRYLMFYNAVLNDVIPESFYFLFVANIYKYNLFFYIDQVLCEIARFT